MTVTFCGHRTLEHPVQVKSCCEKSFVILLDRARTLFSWAVMERLTSWLPKLFMS